MLCIRIPPLEKQIEEFPSALSRAVTKSHMPRQDDCFRTPRRSTRTPPFEASHSPTHCQATEWLIFLNSKCMACPAAASRWVAGQFEFLAPIVTIKKNSD